MNKSLIQYILGYVLMIEGVLFSIPCITALCYQEKEGFMYLGVGGFCIIVGLLMRRKKPKNDVFYLKEGCVTTSLSWIFLSFFGCIPFVLTGEIPFFINALFETVSGFTTTGASILSDVESLSHCSIMWRSFTHWIGGMGVLVFLLAIVPMSGGSHINLMRAESPGPSVGKLVPKVKQTAQILYLIYFALTFMLFILLLFGGMSVFEALNTSVATAGTGGFGIKNDSLISYSPYIQWVVTIFMLLFGVNFNAYYLIIFRQFSKAFKMEEVRYYFIIIGTSILIIFLNILHMFSSWADALRHSAFQVATIITTCGFSTCDFDLWPETSKTILVLLMFVGACAGSTGGGMKVSRFVIMFKTVMKELRGYIHPKSIQKINMDEKPIPHEVVRSVNVYLITFIVVFVSSVFLISFDGNDLTTNFTAIAATINNIGPGLSKVGPTCNFGFFSPLSKIVMIIDMLAGRLELFPLLILFHPSIWRDGK
ncbi:MAG: TrkH family potassium uptake protein [Lachnospiraceae bacterium]|jgi:trk system potassium uptake protein TrkH|nr:TrkH family potassium uptake protein [Lachnospiraceae bacterium]